jgi:Fic family protein
VFHYEFEFIHPFSDGNGRVGRLWQTLILSKWQPVFINIPVESLVHQHQEDYYQAIRRSTSQGDSAPFVEFMLQMVMSAIAETESAPKSVGLNDGTSDGLKSEVKLSDQDKAVLTLIRADPYVTIQKIAQSLDKSVRTIERRIKYLKENSLISRVGAKKSGKWIVHS